MDIRIPKLGEGVNSGTVVSILVKEGDLVKKDQTVLELETDKAVAPIPSEEAGVVSKILIKEGQSVSVGQAIISLASSGKTAPAVEAPAVKSASASPAPAAPITARISVPPAAVPAQPGGYYYEAKSGVEPPASPSIRKLAREIGLDLRKVKGSEHGGRIILDDVRAYIQFLEQAALGSARVPASSSGTAAVQTAAKPAAEAIDFSKWGPVTRKAISTLRKTIGQRMSESWNSIPHVTQFDEADITSLMEIRKKYAAAYEKKGANLTVTGMMLKTVAVCLQKFPLFNASLDEATGEIVYKNYCHLGVAVDTEAGLIVPVIRDADKKSVLELSLELARLAEKTRQRKIAVDELQGGTFTISNLGGIGGSYFTPIVNRPQAAILGVSRGVLKPVVVKADSKKGKAQSVSIEPRMMMPLALSYDHRIVDGADGARFIRELVTGLENYNEKDLKI